MTGSDQALYPPMSTAARDNGGSRSRTRDFDPVQPGSIRRPDLVVHWQCRSVQTTSEARAAHRLEGLDVPARSPDALYELAIAGKPLDRGGGYSREDERLPI